MTDTDDRDDAEHTAARLDEAEALLNALWHCSDDAREEMLLAWVREILDPLVAAGYPRAIWMNAGILGMGTGLSTEAFDAAHLEAMRSAAAGGCADAQFHLGHWHYEREERAAATALYKQAADAGHTYAKWCYGLDRMAGCGTAENHAEGLGYIQDAADNWFEGALQFLVDAYARGQHGFPVDTAKAAHWRGKLRDRRVIHY